MAPSPKAHVRPTISPSGSELASVKRHCSPEHEIPKPGANQATGASLVTAADVDPVPSCPRRFDPEHDVRPATSTRQLAHRPASRDAVPVTAPGRATGVLRSTVSPVPSAPVPLSPQHSAVPSTVIAQVWYSPGARDR